MDWTVIRNKTNEFFRKYRYAALVLAVGIFLMVLPQPAEEPEQAALEQEPSGTGTAQELEQILAQIEGVGKVTVMLTERSGGMTHYQTDEDRDIQGENQSLRTETVIVTDGDRKEQGLVKQTDPPVWLGAIVVCQGADRPSVRLGVVEAVANVTGISTDRITVLKMK